MRGVLRNKSPQEIASNKLHGKLLTAKLAEKTASRTLTTREARRQTSVAPRHS